LRIFVIILTDNLKLMAMQKTYNLQLTKDELISLDSFLTVINEESCGSPSDLNAIFDLLKIAVEQSKEIATDGIEAARAYVNVIAAAKQNGSDLNEIQDKAFQLITNED